MGDPRNTTLPHVCYPAEFDRSRSNGTSVIKVIHQKNLTPCILSRSLKVIGTDVDQSTTYGNFNAPNDY